VKNHSPKIEPIMRVGEYVVVFLGTKILAGKVTKLFDDGTCEVDIPKHPPIRLPQEEVLE